MQFSITGYQVKQKRKLDHWSPILEEWILATERYCRMTEGEDAPYLFTELANVGIVSASIWRCGGIALQEYQAEKGAKHRPKWNGRVDLWLKTTTVEQLLEAKMLTISMDARRELADVISGELDKALNDAKSSRNNFDVDALGALFVVPYLTVNRAQNLLESEESDLHEHIAQYVNQVIDTNNYHAVAWCFPKEMRQYLLDHTDDLAGSDYLYPGVILLIKNEAYR
ncbi:hypothetical protein [Oceanospirillum sediminis]|uniref:Uncharacterized protein n=1 Tax=Oceanospirillum sediminis TaxID=2760088 RepID=A0A839IT47_9GAMM|nr:hypothetical protein [Oceanospirillum sediminis]MBB1488633.1 hypothetical protein [Oceanospirillum sediminis]